MLLQMRNISKSFPGVQALDRVDFELNQGEIHILVGENGAGKSTLMKILAGIIKPDSGEILLEEQKIAPESLLQAQKLGISIVLQELNLIPELTVAENLVLINRPEAKLFSWISKAKMKKEACQIFSRLGIALDENRLIRELSLAEKQLVEIAKGLSFQAKVLILDEPTSALAEKEIERLFRLLRELKQQGIGIIYISHRLEEIYQIGDRVTVLRDGKKIGTFILAEKSPEELIRLMVGRELKEFYPKTQTTIGDTLLKVKGLFAGKGRLQDISFEVKRGEVLGLAGLIGSGRTELAKALFGLMPIEQGEIIFRGRRVWIKNPRQAIKMGISYLPEDRKEEGLFLDKSVRFNLTITQLDRLSRLGLLSLSREKNLVNNLLCQLQIHPILPEREAQTFSGGNQQKLVLAKWWGVKPELLILDEPTRGIDVGAKVEIHKLITEFASRGNAVIIISSDLPELLGICDRILVLSEGKISGEFLRNEFSQEKIMARAVPHKNLETFI